MSTSDFDCFGDCGVCFKCQKYGPSSPEASTHCQGLRRTHHSTRTVGGRVMSTHTDPLWTLFLWVALAAFIIAVILTAACILVSRWVDATIAAAVDEALVCEDPPWLFDDDHFIVAREPDGWDWLYNNAHALPADAIWFGAEVLADLDELPEVRHG